MVIQKNVSLAKYSRLKIGGPAKYLANAKNVPELKYAINFAKKNSLPVFILGGGTNLIFRDEGYDGLVLRYSNKKIEIKGNRVTVGADCSVGTLIKILTKNNLSGLEWAGGLPGTVGGAVFGNAGAFGGETKDSVARIKSLSLETGKIIWRDKAACDFGYRQSWFKKHFGQEIILETILQFKKDQAKKIRELVNKHIKYRLSRHPMHHLSVGSIFQNVPVSELVAAHGSSEEKIRAKFPVKEDPMPVVPAAYFVQQAGLMGVSFGGAQVSPQHANFIVNAFAASSKDMRAMIDLVKTHVFKKFKVHLKEEIRLVGKNSDEEIKIS